MNPRAADAGPRRALRSAWTHPDHRKMRACTLRLRYPTAERCPARAAAVTVAASQSAGHGAQGETVARLGNRRRDGGPAALFISAAGWCHVTGLESWPAVPLTGQPAARSSSDQATSTSHRHAGPPPKTKTFSGLKTGRGKRRGGASGKSW